METINTFSDHYQVTEIELAYVSKVKAICRPKISSSQEAYEVLSLSWDKSKIELLEQFKVLYLNRANRVLGIYELSTGGITGTVADPRLIFAAGLKLNAIGIILAHNHPSGELKPSVSDEQLTMKIKNAGDFLDIKTLDHLIIGGTEFYSFAHNGLM